MYTKSNNRILSNLEFSLNHRLSNILKGDHNPIKQMPQILVNNNIAKHYQKTSCKCIFF